MIRSDPPIQLWQKQPLIPTTRGFTGETVNKAQRRIDLGSRQASGGEGRAVDGGEIVRSAEYRNPGKVSSLLVVTKKEESLILNNGSAHGATKLVTHVFRFKRLSADNSIDKRADKTIRVARAPLVVAIE